MTNNNNVNPPPLNNPNNNHLNTPVVVINNNVNPPPLNNPNNNHSNTPVVVINNNNLTTYEEIIQNRFLDFLFNGDSNINQSSSVRLADVNPQRIDASFLQNGGEF
ncbi:5049_t:CDS:1 [Diversispora eburnea]|uniref:5049_t:CDS:1 n=1 Tax=Diversispora eburnea TaxID=1213867 RepID=A0A9N9FX03_9GLOM|nr:5049_t:CDS:1 [Diversispora eburnea]